MKIEEKTMEKRVTFYEETNFKNTEIGEIPVDWEVVKLEQVGEVVTGNTPSKAKKEYWINGTIDFVKPPDLRNSCITTASEKISEHAVHVARLVPPGSVLVSCIGNIGRVGYSLKKIAFNQQINAIVPNDSMNSIYLFFALQTQAEQIEKLKAVTTIPIVNKSKFMKVLLPLPPLEEQKAIAYVLSTVQEAREKTEKVIEATKELKKSLMKHLFTYGPVSLEEASRINLKETEIGEIPADWEVVKLEQVGEVLTGNTPSKAKKEYWINGTIDFVKPPDLRNSCITTASEKISEYAVHVARLVPPGSVLVSCVGNIGRVGYSLKKIAFNQQINAIVPNDTINSIYLFFALQTQAEQIEKLKAVTTIPIVNKSKFMKVLIPLPPLPVQKRIAEILQTVDEKIQAEEKKKQALDNLFNSMLHMLMSGKLRVKFQTSEEGASG